MRLNADQLRRRDSKPFPVDIGNGDTVMAKRPDMRLLVLTGALPTPLLNSMMAMMAKYVGQSLESLTEEEVRKQVPDLLSGVNFMIMQALVEPKVVATQADVTDPETMICVDEIAFQTRELILNRVMSFDPLKDEREAARAQAIEFPEQPASEGTPPDVPQLQPATE